MSRRIAVASGKGGTGKTTVAINLAVMAAQARRGPVAYVDCDVEEPNGAIFLRPRLTGAEKVSVAVPRVDETACTACGECRRFCRFNAIALILDRVIVFPELCHGCGGCTLVCPAGAIAEEPRIVGSVEAGFAGVSGAGGPLANAEASAGGAGNDPAEDRRIRFVHGTLNVGEAMPVPVIRAVKQRIPPVPLVILDSPPGTSCAMVESVRGADLVLLVTEPTPFGLNDLAIAVETVRELGLPLAVAVNRSGIGDDRVAAYCREEGIEILAEIPDDRRAAEVYSRGGIIARELPDFGARFAGLLDGLLRAVPEERVGAP